MNPNSDMEYSYFQRKIKELLGIDLSSYKSEQMRRRLSTVMTRAGAQNLIEYHRILTRDPVKLQQFRDFVTINVSEFFRIPDKFEYLRRQILPELLKSHRRLNVWSAGCSNGAEPYTLAIVLNEMAPSGHWRILATDIDTTILDYARHGIYPPTDLRNVGSRHLRKYFTPLGEHYQVADAIKSKVQFRPHDLLRDAYEADFDLIVCRHVIIYFTEEAKEDIFRKFNASLRPGGVLFVGGTEIMKRPKDLGYESLAVSFYRKIEESSSPRIGAPPYGTMARR